MDQATFKLGFYRHFKGGTYEILEVAKHSESGEPFVIYRHDGQWWARPMELFIQTVERDGKTMPRFEYLGNEKLVRDRIPEIMRAEGKTPAVRQADVAEYHERLKAKLREEVDEFAKTPNAEELADILEVVAAASQAFGIDGQEIERVMEEKRQNKGGFDQRFVLCQEYD
jgi:predicted house-cleaning noncanonical NTP pyrophosphatase (MazG superfamily)